MRTLPESPEKETGVSRVTEHSDENIPGVIGCEFLVIRCYNVKFGDGLMLDDLREAIRDFKKVSSRWQVCLVKVRLISKASDAESIGNQ